MARDATFAGVFSSPFASGQLNVTKIGTGTQTFTGTAPAPTAAR